MKITVFSAAVLVTMLIARAEEVEVPVPDCNVVEIYADERGTVQVFATLESKAQFVSLSTLRLPALVIEKKGRYARLEQSIDSSQPDEKPTYWVDTFDVEKTVPQNCLKNLPDDFNICPFATLGMRGSSRCNASQ